MHYETLEKRVEDDQRVRKSHFFKTSKDLRKPFYCSLDERESFLEYMVECGYNIEIFPFEVDPAMGVDCKLNDIVISRNSDMLIYKNIRTIWKPISKKNKVLVYEITYVLAALSPSRLQLTLLGVVSKYDYGSIIPSLGCEPNIGIIKLLEGNAPLATVESIPSSVPLSEGSGKGSEPVLTPSGPLCTSYNILSYEVRPLREKIKEYKMRRENHLSDIIWIERDW